MNYYKNEIKRKAVGLNTAALEVRNGGHVSCFHIGLSDQDMVRRQREGKTCVSSFSDENIVNNLLWDFFHDNEYALDTVCAWLEKAQDGERKQFQGCWFGDEPVGRILLPNGAIRKVWSYELVICKKDDRRGAAEMPFDIVTMYPIED